jgi:CRISPR/Cas system-associated exonuclease Cas4 (RecB family)
LAVSVLASIKLRDFKKNAVGASVVGEYWYCAAKISNMKIHGEIKTPIIIEGAILHEEQAQELLSKMKLRKVKTPETLLDALVFFHKRVKDAMAARSCLVNSEKGTMYLAILPELGCIGRPDLIDCSGGSPVVVEKKYVGRIPHRPWPDEEVQLAVYMLSLERLGFNPSHGILEYNQRNTGDRRHFEVQLNGHLRKKVLTTVETVRGLVQRDEEPIPTKKPTKCRACKYLSDCRWRVI